MLQGVALPGFPDFMSPFRWGQCLVPISAFSFSAFQHFSFSAPVLHSAYDEGGSAFQLLVLIVQVFFPGSLVRSQWSVVLWSVSPE